ncbi:MAG TPA: lipocalin family protein [Ktedonobacterales bacterium]
MSPIAASRRQPAMVLAVLTIIVLMAGCASPGVITGGGRLPQVPAKVPAARLPPIAFPQDEAPHQDLTEWWYYTGHLHGADASGNPHTYGFEFTVFQNLRGPLPPYYAAHFAVSDLTRGAFHYDERAVTEPLSAIPPAGSTHGFALNVGGWHMDGLNGRDHLAAAMDGYRIALSLTGLKPAVLHGGMGLITYGLAGFSYYYSRPLIAVAGTLTDHGTAVSVAGTAWMDHQWGNFITLAGSGWDWYSLQLDDNTEYMLYIIRDAQKRPVSTVGTYVAPDGTASEIPGSAITSTPTGHWTSPMTGGTYPSGWVVTIASQGLTLTITPDLLDQELVTARSTGVAYWEGAASLRGTVAGHTITGQGYVELTGYANLPPGSGGLGIP